MLSPRRTLTGSAAERKPVGAGQHLTYGARLQSLVNVGARPRAIHRRLACSASVGASVTVTDGVGSTAASVASCDGDAKRRQVRRMASATGRVAPASERRSAESSSPEATADDGSGDWLTCRLYPFGLLNSSAFTDGLTLNFSIVHSSLGWPSTEMSILWGSMMPSTFL